MVSEQKTWTFAELTAITEKEIERQRLIVEKFDDNPKLQQQHALAAYVTYRFWVTIVGELYDWVADGERLEDLVSRCFDAPLPSFLTGANIRAERKGRGEPQRYDYD